MNSPLPGDVRCYPRFLDSFTVEHVTVEFSNCKCCPSFLGADPKETVSCHGRMLVEVTDVVANICKLLSMQMTSVCRELMENLSTSQLRYSILV